MFSKRQLTNHGDIVRGYVVYSILMLLFCDIADFNFLKYIHAFCSWFVLMQPMVFNVWYTFFFKSSGQIEVQRQVCNKYIDYFIYLK